MENLAAINGKPRSAMIHLLVALVPVLEAAVILYGLKAVAIIAVCVTASVLSEFFFNMIAKKPQSATDLSAAVTGLILALCLPAETTLWQCLVGSIFAIVIVKCAFGGFGKNFVNPAVAAKVMLVIAFASTAADSIANVSAFDRFFGYVEAGAPIGSTSAFAVLVGALYLLLVRVIKWEAPLAYILGVFALSFAFGGTLGAAVSGILGGGVIFGAIFLLTDPVTSPKKTWGKVVYALLCAVLTVLINKFGTYGAHAVAFAILFMNIIVPYVDMLIDAIEAKMTKTEEVAE